MHFAPLLSTLFIAAALSLAFAAEPPASSRPATSHPFHGDEARRVWNEVFQADTPSFNTRPNLFLSRCLDRIECKGRALDVAMGEGRNAVLLALRGFDTTGIDISDVAIVQAKKNAAKARVTLHTIEADVFAHDYGTAQWDLVSILYFNPARPILEKFKRAVRPGGYVVIEGFGRRKKGGPPDDTKFDANELLKRFADWHILEYQDGDFDADWGGEPKAHIIRLLAQRPR